MILLHKVNISFLLNKISYNDHSEKILTPSCFSHQDYSKYVYDNHICSKVKVWPHKYSGVKLLRDQLYFMHELLKQINVSLGKQNCVIPYVTLQYSLLLTFACLQRIKFFILFATLLCLRRHVCNYLENNYVKPIQ